MPLVHFAKIAQVCVEKWEDGRGRSRDGRGGCTVWRLLVCSTWLYA